MLVRGLFYPVDANVAVDKTEIKRSVIKDFRTILWRPEMTDEKDSVRFSVTGEASDYTESAQEGSQKSGQTGGQIGGQSLSERTRELLELLKANPFATRAELSATLQISPSAVQKHLEKLKKGYIRRSGGDFGGHWEIISTDR